MKIFSRKILTFFLFLLKSEIVGTVLTSTHKLCFRAKIKICIPQFFYIKVGYTGIYINRTCYCDAFFWFLADATSDASFPPCIWVGTREKTNNCIGENKGADQLRGNREADQRLCFRYTDSTIPLLLKSEISSL